MMRYFASIAALSVVTVSATSYSVVDSFIGPSFLTGFTAQAIADPTDGRVKYVYQDFAKL